jgi:PHP family Zn ribbon phosphoesterase
MEINSREEVHTLAIFDSESQALAMQELVYRHLKGTNRPELFGDQVVANEFDEVEGFNDRMLIGATQLGLDEIINEVHGLGGLSIASHVDRPSFSLLSQLGFIPPDHELDALEISRHLKVDSIHSVIPQAAQFPIVTFSDAHFLDDIGRPCTSLVLEFPNVDEIRLALAEKGGRGVEIS